MVDPWELRSHFGLPDSAWLVAWSPKQYYRSCLEAVDEWPAAAALFIRYVMTFAPTNGPASVQRGAGAGGREFGQAVTEGVHHQLTAILHVELAEDRCQVVAHRGLGDEEAS